MWKNIKKGDLMKARSVIVCTLITMIITSLVFIMGFLDKKAEPAKEVYQVYLDGKKLGAIDNKEQLYSLINKEQSTIKDKYEVDKVYPPNGFNITKDVTYSNKVSDVKDVYEEIKEEKPFTIKGYVITIKYKDEKKKPVQINVLDQNVFKEALDNLITSFIPENEYRAYMNDTQVEIVETGSLIETIYFDETITVKEAYITTDDKIYTDVQELSQYLMFGNKPTEEKYTVNQGDTISTVAFNHKLNEAEFLIANPSLKSADSLLSIGQQVNIALINPIVTLNYEMHVVEDVDIDYEVETTYDDTQLTTYSEVTQAGVKGVNRITKKVKYANGEENQGAVIVSYETIKEPQTEKVIKGSKKPAYSEGGGGYTSGTYIDNGASWAWPTNSPYILTSPYAYRWGKLHDGLDISGTGYGSPIYASLDGVVVHAGNAGYAGSSAGINVIINHENGYYTLYAHMSSVSVSVGQRVSRRQKIGAMGKTGVATGTHVHFAVWVGGIPYHGGKSINPLELWL